MVNGIENRLTRSNDFTVKASDLNNGSMRSKADVLEDEFERDAAPNGKLFSGQQRSTPPFIKKMMEYCLSEIAECIDEDSIDDYVESVGQLVSHLLSPNYPCELVNSADRAEILEVLKAHQEKMTQKRDNSQNRLLNRAGDDIALLEKSFASIAENRPFELPKIVNRDSFWKIKENWGRRIFEPPSFRAMDEKISHQNPTLKKYEICPVSNDGGCWARALWHATLAQLTVEEKMLDFSQRVRGSVACFAKDRKFFINNDLSDVLAIVKMLSRMPVRERLDAMCFERIDLTLQMFTRKLVASLLRLENTEKSEISKEYIDRIELPSTFGGAHEINCFVKYFGSQIQEIACVVSGDNMKPQFHIYNQKAPAVESDDLNDVIMFGSSPIHYEVLYRK